MLIGVRVLRLLAPVVLLAAIGCHAQTTSSGTETIKPGTKLSLRMARRVELLIRTKAQIPSDYSVTFSEPVKSEIPGYSQIDINFFLNDKLAKSAIFLLSEDGATLAQLSKFDLSKDPAASVPSVGRPARGGPADAPVTIVGFDDLECPFCAQMNAALFPAVLNRYKNQVRVIYRDFPLEEIHPWAKHAAIDANCLAAQSTPAYWNYVDNVHAHAADMAGPDKKIEVAAKSLDQIALDEGTRQKINQPALVACVLKQDESSIKASEMLAEADPLHIDSAPTLFVNGEKIEGVVPVETLFHIIDRALVAAGQTPPPPPPPASPPPAPKPTS